MTAQRYNSPAALKWMAAGNCPECGQPADSHTGWGSPGCSLTDNGVAERLQQYQTDAANIVISFRIKGGIITEATERREKPSPALVGDLLPTVLTERGDIEDAVARVANTPVSGKISEEK